MFFPAEFAVQQIWFTVFGCNSRNDSQEEKNVIRQEGTVLYKEGGELTGISAFYAVFIPRDSGVVIHVIKATVITFGSHRVRV